MTRLDPRDPWVIDTRELSRRPGTLLEVVRSLTAPEDLGTDIVAVPTGSPVELDARLESVSEGVLVSGEVRATAGGACVRCLEPVTVPVAVPFQELLCYSRCERAARLLLGTDMRIFEIALVCGFSDVKYLIKYFRRFFHSTPSSFRKLHRADSAALALQTRYREMPLGNAARPLPADAGDHIE